MSSYWRSLVSWLATSSHLYDADALDLEKPDSTPTRSPSPAPRARSAPYNTSFAPVILVPGAVNAPLLLLAPPPSLRRRRQPRASASASAFASEGKEGRDRDRRGDDGDDDVTMTHMLTPRGSLDSQRAAAQAADADAEAQAEKVSYA